MLELFAPVVYALELDTVLLRINYYIINPLIRILFAVAFVIFVAGVIQYVLKRDSIDAKEQGRKHIMWGLIGLAIMTSVFFIIRILTSTFGLDEVQIDESNNSIEVNTSQVEVQ
jgi:FtsH-binding integral membrane protein